MTDYREILAMGENMLSRMCSRCWAPIPTSGPFQYAHTFVEFSADSGRALGGVWFCKDCCGKAGTFPRPLELAWMGMVVERAHDFLVSTSLFYFGVHLGFFDNDRPDNRKGPS